MYPLTLDIETAPIPEFENDDRAALDPKKGRVTCIGFCNHEVCQVFSDPDERKMLVWFINFMKDTEWCCSGLPECQPVVITGYCVDRFDLEFLKKRCEAHGLQMPNGFKVCDLYVRGKFDDAAAVYGIFRESPLRGDVMPRLWREGNIAGIKEHNLDDVKCEWKYFMALKSSGQLDSKVA